MSVLVIRMLPGGRLAKGLQAVAEPLFGKDTLPDAKKAAMVEERADHQLLTAIKEVGNHTELPRVIAVITAVTVRVPH